MNNTPKDGIRTAAAVLVEDVGKLAGDLAALLRSDAELPPAAVAGLMVWSGRAQGQLVKQRERLDGKGKQR
jgi:hypothetical protein